MAGGFFISKKSKKLMKERRRKKKLAETGQLPESSSTTNEERPNKKRPRPNGAKDDSAAEAIDDAKTLTKQQQSTTKEAMILTIPANLSAKEVKKFRKDARRQARLEGRDETQLQFVVEGEEPLPPRKKKRVFPSINELVKQEKLQQEQRDKVQHEDDLPDDYKVKYVALDCEMVGIGADGKKSALARVSLVDWWGKTVLDTFVQVPTKVTDFRTFVSGVKPKHIQSADAMDVKKCRETVSNLIKDKVLVGHALKNDLHALMLQHPKELIRDTAHYRPFQRFHKKWRPRKLRDLVKEHCDVEIQVAGESHDSVDDAAATMKLFQTVHQQWEKELQLKATKQMKQKR